MTFEEIMGYHPRNDKIYGQIVKQFNNIVPYIGAGLSAGIMPTWKEALRKLCDNITDSKEKERIISLVEVDLFDTVSELEKYFGTFNFCKDVVELFSENHIDSWDSKLLEMSVGQLAALFPESPVITTNFDRVLEHAFIQSGHMFEHILGPTAPFGLLADALQSHSHILYKIHGDIGRNNTDYKSFIFSKEQYEQYYSDGTQLVKQLSDWLKGKFMLFIGCSLEDDYPIRLLNQIVHEEDYKNSLTHFAIINCKAEKLDKRSLELGDKHISAIFYPDGEWDCVNVILKKLYEDTIFPTILERAGKLRDLYSLTRKNAFKADVYDIYIHNPKNWELATCYMDTILSDLVHSEKNEQIAKLSEIKALYPKYEDYLDVQMIYMNALYHCVRGQPKAIH